MTFHSLEKARLGIRPGPLFALFLACCPPLGAQAADTAQLPRRADAPVFSRAAALPDFSALVEQQGPAVVNVVTSRRQAEGHAGPSGEEKDPLTEFFKRFAPDAFPDQPKGQPTEGLGSGFIISPDGIILTNAHVVADADTVTVRMADGKHEYTGKVLGADPRSDVAVVKIDARNLPVARLGKANSVKPGEWVAAIGSPFGFSNTITAGIVSATGRSLPDENLVSFIQTDVAVNPGNSGGPLLNLKGEVVGVNSIIYSRTGGYMGVSFAIPIETALDVANQLRSQGRVIRGRIGVGIQPVTKELAQAFKLPSTSGALVGQVEPGSPADRASIQNGDIIVAYNGKAIDDAGELPRLVAATRPGTPAKVDLWRDGEKRRLTVTVGDSGKSEQAAITASEVPVQAPNRLGLVVSELTSVQRKQLGIDHGILVEGIHGPAAQSGIRPGDVIQMFNHTKVADLAQFNQLLSQQPPGSSVALLVRRGQNTAYVSLPVPSPAG